MSNEELAMAIQRGENRYEELWEQVRRFVCQQANAYRLYFPVSTIDTDDLIQAGYLAFVDAVQVYDPDAGRFLTLLGFYLRKRWRELYGLRGRRELLDNAVSLDEPIDEDGETTRLDLLPDERAELAFTNAEDDVFRTQLRAVLDKALDAAPYGDIVRRRLQGHSQAQIAADLGCSCSRVGQYERTCRRYLRSGPHSRALREFAEGFDFYRGTGLRAWKRTGETIQEKYLLRQERVKK